MENGELRHGNDSKGSDGCALTACSPVVDSNALSGEIILALV